MAKKEGGVDLVIRGGKVVAQGRTSALWIAADAGRIVAMGCSEGWPEEKETIDVTGKYVLPGVIDNEHHPSEAVGDLFLAETRAAIASGVTTVGIETASVDFMHPPKTFPKLEEVPMFEEVLPNVKKTRGQ